MNRIDIICNPEISQKKKDVLLLLNDHANTADLQETVLHHSYTDAELSTMREWFERHLTLTKVAADRQIANAH